MGGSGIAVAAMVVMMVLMGGGMILGVGAGLRRWRRQRRPERGLDTD